MRRILLSTLLLFAPLPAQKAKADTNFYEQTTGSNLNAGSTNTDAATFTYAGGTFVRSSRVFTVASGTPSSDFTVDGTQFASVYTTSGTVATGYVALITARDATTITLSATALSGAATTVSETANAATLKIGGAWKGPNGSDWFPLGFVAGAMVNTSGGAPVHVWRKTGRYVITETAGNAGITNSNAGPVVWEGYTTTPGDGTLNMTRPDITGDSDNNGTADVTPFHGWTIAGTRHELRYLQFSHNGYIDPGPNLNGEYMVRTTSGGTSFTAYRCKFDHTWRDGLRTGATAGLVIECEGNACNREAGNTYGQFNAYNSTQYLRCWAHHSYKAGDAGAPGFCFQAGAGALVTYDSCISSHNGGQGWWNVTGAPVLTMRNCIAYNNDLSGIEFANNSTGTAWIENCLFVDNGEAAIRHDNTTWSERGMNNGFWGNGTEQELTAVTCTNAGDVFGKTTHGLVNGNIVYASSFSAGFTTGMYYVVGSATNTFQLSATLGGSAVPVTADGTGGSIKPQTTNAYAGPFINSVLLTGDPFTDGDNGNFTLNSTAGAACKQAALAAYLIDTTTTSAVAGDYGSATTSTGASIGAIIPAGSTGSVIFGTPP